MNKTELIRQLINDSRLNLKAFAKKANVIGFDVNKEIYVTIKALSNIIKERQS